MPPELYAINKKVLGFFSRYHAVTFIAFICLVLAIAILLLYQVVQSTFTPPDSVGSTIPDFNQQTITKIKNLRDSSSGPSTLQLPSPRSNPFSE